MIQRGRKSAAKLQTVALQMTRKSPKVPIELTQGAAKIWCDIVESLPADYFRAGDLPLLAAYCTAANRKNQIDAAIANEGLMYDGVAHPGLKVSREEASLMASLAVKLRLCQSSRTRPDSASLQAANSGRRPWDTENKFANNGKHPNREKDND